MSDFDRNVAARGGFADRAAAVDAGLRAYMLRVYNYMAAAVALSFGVAFALLVGFSLNWYLGLAPLFCLRNGVHPREAMGEAIDFSAEYGGRLTLIGLAFFVLRLLWLAAMSFIVVRRVPCTPTSRGHGPIGRRRRPGSCSRRKT